MVSLHTNMLVCKVTGNIVSLKMCISIISIYVMKIEYPNSDLCLSNLLINCSKIRINKKMIRPQL